MQRARGLRTSSFGSNLGANASYHAPLVVSRAPLEKPMREVSAEEREEIEQAFQLFDSNKAVSYTHLTLPTNREV